jgi:hypothetical protein
VQWEPASVAEAPEGKTATGGLVLPPLLQPESRKIFRLFLFYCLCKLLIEKKEETNGFFFLLIIVKST